MNKVILVGRLCNDLELRYVGERNTAVVKFTLAITRDYKNAQGKYDTDFIRCELWNKRAEAFYQYLKKGELVGVEGKLRLEKYTTADGEKRSAVIVRCDDFTFMPSSNRKEPSSDNVFHAESVFESEAAFDNAVVSDMEIPESDIPF